MHFFKTPPSYFKKNGTKICKYSKRPPPTSKKAFTTTNEPIKNPNFVFIQNAPLLLKAPQKSPQNDKVLESFKTPPSYLKKAISKFVFIKNASSYFQKSGYYHKEAHEKTNVLIYSSPPPSFFKKSGTKFCIYSKSPLRIQKRWLLPYRYEMSGCYTLVFCIFYSPPAPKKKKK